MFHDVQVKKLILMAQNGMLSKSSSILLDIEKQSDWLSLEEERMKSSYGEQSGVAEDMIGLKLIMGWYRCISTYDEILYKQSYLEK